MSFFTSESTSRASQNIDEAIQENMERIHGERLEREGTIGPIPDDWVDWNRLHGEWLSSQDPTDPPTAWAKVPELPLAAVFQFIPMLLHRMGEVDSAHVIAAVIIHTR